MTLTDDNNTISPSHHLAPSHSPRAEQHITRLPPAIEEAVSKLIHKGPGFVGEEETAGGFADEAIADGLADVAAAASVVGHVAEGEGEVDAAEGGAVEGAGVGVAGGEEDGARVGFQGGEEEGGDLGCMVLEVEFCFGEEEDCAVSLGEGQEVG